MDRITALQAFVRVVDKGSFTAASAELRVKQSTVSKWLAALEEELGVRLLDRTTRSQRVTEAGLIFYDHAQGVIAAFDAGVAEVRRTAPTLRGRIRMSLPVVFGTRFIVPTLSKFARQHQEIELDLVFNDRYVSLIEEGFDLAIRVGLAVDSTLRSHALGTSPRRLVASPQYLRRHGFPENLRALEQHQCLVHTELGVHTVWNFANSGRTHRVSVRGRISANNSEATLTMARRGMGICLLASWLVDKDLRAGRLLQLLEDFEPPPARVRALTPPGKHVAPRVRALIAHLRENLDP